jgi:hypothetical protein
MSFAQRAYLAGSDDAKVAFLGELYRKHIKGETGPLLGSLLTEDPLSAGLAGAAGQAIDTPPGGSKILRSLGVGGGAALANALVNPVANIVATAVVSALGLPIRAPVFSAGKMPNVGWLLKDTLRMLPTGAAQMFAASKGRDAAEHVEKFLKTKGTRIP